MLQRDDGLGDGVYGQGSGAGRVCPTKNQDGPRNLGAAQTKGLGKV